MASEKCHICDTPLSLDRDTSTQCKRCRQYVVWGLYCRKCKEYTQEVCINLLDEGIEQV